MRARWLFDDQALCAKLASSLEQWRGTPFFPQQAVRGVGVDCVRFVIAVLQEVGALGAVEFPRYAIKGGGPELLDMIERALGELPHLALLWSRDTDGVRPELLAGDIVVFSNRKSFHHLALAASPEIVWHAVARLGVFGASVNDSRFAQHIAAVYRLQLQEGAR